MKAILLFALIFFVSTKDEFPMDKDVIILTDATIDKALEKYEHLLVMFYAPWCGHCKKMHPEFEKAATKLKAENLFLAKLDATVEKNSAEKYGIQGFPTVKLFNKGQQPIEYNGGRKEAEIITWMRKKTGPVTKELKTKDDVEKFIAPSDVAVIYFGNDKKNIETYNNVARNIEDMLFGLVQDEKIFPDFKAEKETLVIFKKFDEKKNVLKEITEKSVKEFIDKYTSPRVMKFDDKAAQIIFGKNLPAIMLYAMRNDTKWESYDKLMHDVADKIDGKLKVVLTDIKDGMAARLAEYIGVKESDLPTVRIADTTKDLKKYNMQGEIKLENVLKFVKDWEEKKLTPVYKSAEVPADNNGDVFVVVGKSFKKEVIDNDKDVMLLFYAPWCGHCKALHPKYEDVARKLKKNNPKLLMAKMDATENEVDSVTINGFPTVKFYPGNNKTEPIEYDGDRTAEDIIQFIKKNAFNKINYEEPKKEEKKEEKKEKKEEKKEKKEEKKDDKKETKKDDKKKTADL